MEPPGPSGADNTVVVTPGAVPVGGVATVAELNPPARHGLPWVPPVSVNVGLTCLKFWFVVEVKFAFPGGGDVTT